uniref:Tetratricopeptide repeat protein n=1 Tax=uncultured bacterium 70 TaxID=698392 RepID=E3T6I4_9BACT|nr:hypothetical protein [uncultured bacterium 70]
MTDDQNDIDAQASVLMKSGIRLFDEGSAEAAAEALGYFDRALLLRRTLPIDAVPVFRYGLAACLLNRADALVRLGGDDNLSDALGAYDEASSLLQALPLSDDPRFPRRLAMAHQNRGVALQIRDAADPRAVAAFGEALTVLGAPEAASIADRQYLQGATLANLANAWTSRQEEGAAVSARQAATDAMVLVAETEAADVDAAEVGLKARHVLCRTVARQLSTTGPLSDGVHEATDAVDDGLRLVRLWEQKGVEQFRPIAADLFRFGAMVYGTFQPHFLEEFLHDQLDPASAPEAYFESAEMRAAFARVRRALENNA